MYFQLRALRRPAAPKSTLALTIGDSISSVREEYVAGVEFAILEFQRYLEKRQIPIEPPPQTMDPVNPKVFEPAFARSELSGGGIFFERLGRLDAMFKKHAKTTNGASLVEADFVRPLDPVASAKGKNS